VSSSAASGSIAGGTPWCDGYQVRTNDSRCPASTLNSDTVRRLTPRIGTVVRSASASGPAIAMRVSSSSRCTQGTIDPYPNRITSSNLIRTDPSSPSTIRTTSGSSPRGGMKSVTRTTPSVVWKSSSCTSVRPR
jgi:hypothetical protein